MEKSLQDINRLEGKSIIKYLQFEKFSLGEQNAIIDLV